MIYLVLFEGGRILCNSVLQLIGFFSSGCLYIRYRLLYRKTKFPSSLQNGIVQNLFPFLFGYSRFGQEKLEYQSLNMELAVTNQCLKPSSIVLCEGNFGITFVIWKCMLLTTWRMTWCHLSEFTHLGAKPSYLEIVTAPVWFFHFILLLIHPVTTRVYGLPLITFYPNHKKR